jgi:hypothetical protein
MGLIDDIKNDVKKSGTNKKKIVYFKPGVKNRIRFLQEMDAGMKILFHDSFEAGVNIPCQEFFDRKCERHEDEDLRHRQNYAWSVWNQEAKEVQILLGPVNNYSPIPLLVGMYDAYGTITDRDYVITKTGKGTEQTWAVVPMDKVRFKNEKAKPFSEAKTLAILDKAFPCEDSEDEDEEEEPIKKKRKVVDEDDEPVKKKKKAAPIDEDEDEDEEPVPKKKKKVVVEDEEDEEEEPVKKKKAPAKKKKKQDYEDFTAKELYLECKERDMSVKQKMDEEYYIAKLEANDEGDADDEEEW